MKVLTGALLAITVVAGTACAQQAKDDLFAGTNIFEKNATSVTDINMGPDNLGMVSGHHADTAKRMMLNFVRSYEYDQPGLYNMADVDKFRQKLSSGAWSCSIHERNLKTGESTDVCSKERTDGYRETAIISVEKKELTFIHRIEKEGADGHSDVSMGAGLSGLESMPGMMTLNSAKLDAQMAVLEAKLGAGVIGMHGPIVMIPDGVVDGQEKTFFLKRDTDDGEKTGKDMQLKMRRFSGSPSGRIMMDQEDAKSPKAPAADVVPPAPAAPATQP
jgi:hypothetical protein